MQKFFKHSTTLIPFIMMLLLFVLVRPGYINGPDLLLSPSLQITLYGMFLVYWMGVCPFRKSCNSGDLFEILYNLVPVMVAGFFLFLQYHFLLSMLIIILVIVVYRLGIYFWKRASDYEEHREDYRRVHHRFTVVLLLLFTLLPAGCAVFGYGLAPYHVEADKEQIVEFTPKDVRKTPDAAFLKEFSEENWKRHPTEEKAALLQTLVNYECAKLGVKEHITVKTEVNGLSQMGSFDREAKLIRINVRNLETLPAETIMETILHETFHAFQNDLIERVDWKDPVTDSAYFDQLRIWKQNQEDYVRANPLENPDSVEGYEKQPLEASARAYAEEEYKALEGYRTGRTPDTEEAP